MPDEVIRHDHGKASLIACFHKVCFVLAVLIPYIYISALLLFLVS